MKVYGSKICSDCREFQAVMAERGLDADFIEITQDVPSMRAFLKLRDTEPVFDAIRAESRIGIPVFVNDDGRVTLDANEALAWIGQPPMYTESSCEGCR